MTREKQQNKVIVSYKGGCYWETNTRQLRVWLDEKDRFRGHYHDITFYLDSYTSKRILTLKQARKMVRKLIRIVRKRESKQS